VKTSLAQACLNMGLIMSANQCDYVVSHYGVPACIGRRVIVNGRPGIIAEDLGHHIGVNFDDTKPGVIFPAHPTWKVEYGEMGVVRPLSRSQRNYCEYLKVADLYDGFGDWLRAKARERRFAQ
jgi:hypothetical protein